MFVENVVLSDLNVTNKFLKSLGSEISEFICDGDTVSAHSLKRLNIANQKLNTDNILNLSRLSNLSQLNLSFNKIEDLTALKSLQLLEYLDVSHNKVTSLDSVRDLIRMRVLRCNSNNIESIEPLSKLHALEILWISNNNINWTDFIYVTNLNKLKHLCKSGNPSDEKPKANEVSADLSNKHLRRFIFAVYFGVTLMY